MRSGWSQTLCRPGVKIPAEKFDILGRPQAMGMARHRSLSERWRNRRKNGYVLGDFTGEESADDLAEYVCGLVGHTS